MKNHLSILLFITVIFTLVLALGILISGCVDDKGDEKTEAEKIKEEDYTQDEDNKEKDKEVKEIEIDYEEVKPNELGEIMILMYHDIGDELGDWKTSREKFREDMERLYEKDYRLVDLIDLVNGEIDIPVGTTPVVLTFDDGHKGQFNVIEEDGKKIVDPESAAGILLEFEEKYEDFTLAGNFYINYYPEPFGDRDNLSENLQILIENGFSVGNHGYAHENLRNVSSPEDIQKELGKMQKIVKEATDGYRLESLALSYGGWPENEEWHEYVYSGEYEGITYNHKAVLNVSWSPEISPFHSDFDPLDLERIKANDGVDQEMDRWLEGYEQNPQKRYISDGNPNTIAIPEQEKEKLNEEVKEEYEIITY